VHALVGEAIVVYFLTIGNCCASYLTYVQLCSRYRAAHAHLMVNGIKSILFNCYWVAINPTLAISAVIAPKTVFLATISITPHDTCYFQFI